ncbi:MULTISPECIES: ferredoxin [Nocardioides]|uniref:Ferredoxin n=1 Tax=Nocardioides vastitatis TaxID=2568655 RepID=A0ABW0ZR30_9ACTN|nr:ferredoxin [Nocardioides sp.]THI96066.1 ferredoxin [Nocardioides sp.]
MKVIADTSICQGHQLCQGEAPDVFGFDEAADVVALLEEHPDETRRAAVTTAVRYCPAFALSIEED